MCVRNVLGRALALDAAAQGLAITKLTLYELPFNSGDQRAWAAAQHYSRELSARLRQGRRGDAVTLAMTTWGAPPQAVAGMRQTPIWPLFEAVAPTLAYDECHHGGWHGPGTTAGNHQRPTLVMAGGARSAFIQEAARAVARALPNARLQILAGQTHEVAPEVLAPVLGAFLTD